MSFDPRESRIGLYLCPTGKIWEGTVVSYVESLFTLTVSTDAGDLADVRGGMAVVTAEGDWARITAVNPGAGTITLAENPYEFVASDGLSIYPPHLPFPRYQFIDSNGVIYKDYNIAWPGQYASMPPIGHCKPAVIIADVGESVALDASGSVAMTPGGSISSYAWDAGTGGTITGSGATVSVSYSTVGFRYLLVTVTDNQSTTHTRYMPVWVGLSPNTGITRARMTWRAGGGWVVDIAAPVAPDFLERSPVVLVDLETEEILFFGFMDPYTVDYDFETESLSFSALSPVAYLSVIYSYPFLLESVGVDVATNWAEVYSLTLQRAVWFLLVWHSTLPQIANVSLPSPDRTIAGQKFAAGTLQNQVRTANQAAFWEAAGERDGGIVERVDPAYNASFDSLTTLTFNDTDVEGAIAANYQPAGLSEARLSGVYWDGGQWAPLIVRSPQHPLDLGRPGEVAGLAPLNVAELRAWAGRHLALSRAVEYPGISSLLDIDPYVYPRVVLPDGTALALRSLSYGHNVQQLRWNITFTGRAWGGDASTRDEPQPPEIVIPVPTPPVDDPPLPFMPPPEDWPTIAWFFSRDNGPYYTENFSGPDGDQPTWTLKNTLSAGGTLLACDVGLVNRVTGTAFVIVGRRTLNTGAVYRFNGTAWDEVLTGDQAADLGGYTDAKIAWIDVDKDGNLLVWAKIDEVAIGSYKRTRMVKSDVGDDGVYGTFYDFAEITSASFWGNGYGNGDYKYNGSEEIILSIGSIIGAGAPGKLQSSINYGTASRSNDLWTSIADGVCYYNQYGGIAYAVTPSAVLKYVDLDTGVVTQPAASVAQMTGTLATGWPKLDFRSDGNTELAIGGTAPFKNYLSKTTDNWATKSSYLLGKDVDWLIQSYLNENYYIMGREENALISDPHVLYVTDDEGVTPLIERAGNDPQNASTTTSIPYNCGGGCFRAFGVVL